VIMRGRSQVCVAVCCSVLQCDAVIMCGPPQVCVLLLCVAMFR